MLSSRQQSQKLSARRVWGRRRERAVSRLLTHRAPPGRSYSIRLAGLMKHSILYLLGCWRCRVEIYNNSCSIQPNWLGTGRSYVFQNSFSTFLHELRCMKISVLKQPDVFVRKEIDDLKEAGRINSGLGEENGTAGSSCLSHSPYQPHHDYLLVPKPDPTQHFPSHWGCSARS